MSLKSNLHCHPKSEIIWNLHFLPGFSLDLQMAAQVTKLICHLHNFSFSTSFSSCHSSTPTMYPWAGIYFVVKDKFQALLSLRISLV